MLVFSGRLKHGFIWTFMMMVSKNVPTCPSRLMAAPDTLDYLRCRRQLFRRRFDGIRFDRPKPAEVDSSHLYARKRTNTPGRCIQIAWMRDGSYPGMPFNQQMSFPCELKLRTFPDGLRICRLPVREIENIRGKKHKWENKILAPGENLLSGITGELFDIRAEFEISDSAEFGIKVRGEAIIYNAQGQKIYCLASRITGSRCKKNKTAYPR
jgi:sucrose-6-phosphate hydrolase SacC (GH32 family)